MKRLWTSIFLLFLACVVPCAVYGASPQVTSTDPSNGMTNVPLNKVITITFDQTMAWDTIEQQGGKYNIELLRGKNKVAVTYSPMADSTTYTLTPTANLLPNTKYQIRIRKKVENTRGDSLVDDLKYTFTTVASAGDVTPPTVTQYDPPNGSTSVPITVRPWVSFSEAINDSTVTDSTFYLTKDGSKLHIPVTYSYDTDTHTIQMTPTASLEGNTTYRVTVKGGGGGIKDLAGNPLQNDLSWVFSTVSLDTVKPTVTAVSPLEGATGVDVTTQIVITFSENMDPSSINTTNITVSNGVIGTVTYDDINRKAIFTPSSTLSFGTTYTVTVRGDTAVPGTTGVRDVAGNSLCVKSGSSCTAANYTWSFTTQTGAGVVPLTDYVQIPAYVSSGPGVQPNVLLIVDNSGSMEEFAYKSKTGMSGAFDNSYVPTKNYYGYFEMDRMYEYNTTGGYFQINTSTTLDRTRGLKLLTDKVSGNFLNWLTMRRIDVIKQVLIGGKTIPRTTGTNNYRVPHGSTRETDKTYNSVYYEVAGTDNTPVINVCTSSSCSSYSANFSARVYIGQAPSNDGLIQTMGDRIRFAVMLFNTGTKYESGGTTSKDGGYIPTNAWFGSSIANLVSVVESAIPSTWTPLAETFYEGIRLFEAATSAYNSGTDYATSDPFQYQCQRNFIIVLTDGESTKDQNVPGGSFGTATKVSDPYGLNVKTWMDKITTLQNDGTNYYSTAANTMQGTYYLAGLSYYAHLTDLRSSSVGKNDKPGTQNITTYTVFAFDDSPVGKKLLELAAKYGGFEDINGSGSPDLDEEWKNPTTGVARNYFEVQEGDKLKSSLEEVFKNILAKISSGTAASILSNSEGSGANIIQALFFPKRYFDTTAVEWVGELHDMWYYVDPYINNSTMREDTDYNPSVDPIHYLNLGTDRIVSFYFKNSESQTRVKRFVDNKGDGLPDIDANGDGVAETYTFVDDVLSDSVKSIWKSGHQLWKRNLSSSPRTIYTNIDGTLTPLTSLDTSQSTLWSLLQTANKVETDKLISFIMGYDKTGYRNRTVSIDGVTGTWRLGDIVSSTPKLQSTVKLNSYNLPYPAGYGDSTYGNDTKRTGYIYSSTYLNRGMVYVGANDGMLHAFKLGVLDVSVSGDRKAKLAGSGLGEEQWAFIPRNALPYLKYLADPAYEHLFYVDGTTMLADVSIGVPDGCTSSYWDCAKPSDGSSWRTVLVGSMGLGGASQKRGAGCKATSCVETPVLDPSDSSKGVGYSSYFALDVTNPDSPSLLWEFGGPEVGFSTAGAAIVRISARDANGNPDRTKNGRWFAVIPSGPTGPIDTAMKQFKGSSTSILKFHVLDLATGQLLRTIDSLADGTQLTNAFAGSITAGTFDADRWNYYAPGNYQDDALYVGYVTKDTSLNTWTKGGVLRLVTGHDPDPANWKLSKVIDGIGPVTVNIARLQDRKNKALWLYFGTGRYYFSGDDNSNSRRLYGIKEPCYQPNDTLDHSCTTAVSLGSLTNQTTGSGSTIPSTGWYITLDLADSTYGAERVITDPVAMTNGAVFFTTFRPTADLCSFGGVSYMWGVNYSTGLQLSDRAREGRALVQLSTGAFEEVNFKAVLMSKDGRRTATPMVGKPPSDPPPIVSKSNLKPVKRILHIEEK